MIEKNKMWIPVVALAVVIIILGAAAFFSDGSALKENNAQQQDGELTFAEDKWQLGDISMADGDSVREIMFMNDSDSPVTIIEMFTSCMCTTVQVIHADGSKSRAKGMSGHGEPSTLRERIEPGESAILKVVFDPNAHGPSATGPIDRKVTILTNSSKQDEIRLSFSGNVIK